MLMGTLVSPPELPTGARRLVSVTNVVRARRSRIIPAPAVWPQEAAAGE